MQIIEARDLSTELDQLTVAIRDSKQVQKISSQIEEKGFFTSILVGFTFRHGSAACINGSSGFDGVRGYDDMSISRIPSYRPPTLPPKPNYA